MLALRTATPPHGILNVGSKIIRAFTLLQRASVLIGMEANIRMGQNIAC